MIIKYIMIFISIMIIMYIMHIVKNNHPIIYYMKVELLNWHFDTVSRYPQTSFSLSIADLNRVWSYSSAAD